MQGSACVGALCAAPPASASASHFEGCEFGKAAVQGRDAVVAEVQLNQGGAGLEP